MQTLRNETEYQFYRLCFDPTGNRTCVHRLTAAGFCLILKILQTNQSGGMLLDLSQLIAGQTRR